MTTPDLPHLVALQALDTSIDQHRHRRLHLPERAALSTFHRQVSALGTEAAQVRSQRDEIAERQAEIEAELATTESRVSAENRRLYSGEVRASPDLQALAADVDALKGRASHLEDEVLEQMELREPLDARLSELAAQVAALEEQARTTAAALATSEAVIDDELRRLNAARTDAAAQLPGDLLDTYARLRAHLDGVAVARLSGNHCDGCHLALPAMELDRIRHLSADAVIICEQCGRILVRS